MTKQLKLHLKTARDLPVALDEDRALKINEEERTAELSFSSEIEGERWGYVEVLMHGRDNVRLDRLNSGAALLLNHDRDQQVGVVLEATLKGKRGRAKVKFSDSTLGEEVFRDVKAGIRRLTSVGYEIHKYEVEERASELPIIRATDWEPLEISIVSVPFDPSVGVGRSAVDGEKTALIDISTESKDAPNERGQSTEETADMKLKRSFSLKPDAGNEGGNSAVATPPVTVDPTRENEAQRQFEAESRRLQGITGLVVRHSDVEGIRERAEKAIKDKEGLDTFACWVLEQRGATPVDTNGEIGLSKKDAKEFSLCRAIHALGTGRALPDFEQECSDAVRDKLKFNDNDGARSFYVPVEVTRATQQHRRDLVANNFASAGALITDDFRAGDMIELLRNLQVLPGLGARVLSGLVGNVVIPRQTGGATAYWLSENGTVSDTNQTFGQVTLAPHRLAAATDISGQLLAQNSIDVEAFVRQDLMTVLAIEKDRAALYGTGASGEPLGLVNQSGIGGVTHGGAATWADLVEFETDVASANALMGSLGWILSPATRGKWRTILRDSVAGADYLFPNDGRPVGYPAVVSNQASDNKAFFGNWADMLIADWAGMRIIVDPYTGARSDLYLVTAQMYTDTNIRRAASFSVSTDSAAQ